MSRILGRAGEVETRFGLVGARLPSITLASQLPASPGLGDTSILKLPGEAPIPLVYDSVEGKWRTHERNIITSNMAGQSGWSMATGGANQQVQAFTAVPFKKFTDAGLVPEFRMLGMGASSAGAGANAFAYLWFYHISSGVGDQVALYTTAQATGAPVVVFYNAAGAVWFGTDSGWQRITSIMPGTPKDILSISALIGAAAASTVNWAGSVLHRWSTP